MTMTPGKARHYKTAEFTAHARDTFPHLPSGPVRVQFSQVEHNAGTKQDECVFDVYATMSNTSFIGTYFANALKGFCL